MLLFCEIWLQFIFTTVVCVTKICMIHILWVYNSKLGVFKDWRILYNLSALRSQCVNKHQVVWRNEYLVAASCPGLPQQSDPRYWSGRSLLPDVLPDATEKISSSFKVHSFQTREKEALFVSDRSSVQITSGNNVCDINSLFSVHFVVFLKYSISPLGLSLVAG